MYCFVIRRLFIGISMLMGDLLQHVFRLSACAWTLTMRVKVADLVTVKNYRCVASGLSAC